MSSTRKDPLVTDEYYHVYNRGVARQPTFVSLSDYQQALLSLEYYRFHKPPFKLSTLKKLSFLRQQETLRSLTDENEKQVEIVAFSLMPNHFHFLLKQVEDGGIAGFISKFSNSYTKYFNTKRKRVGPVFQGIFKAVHIESTNQLLHVSRYIHINSVVSGIITLEQLVNHPWSSFSASYSHAPII